MQTMREDAETILREAVAAAQPGRLVREALAAERLTGRIVLLAAGRSRRSSWRRPGTPCRMRGPLLRRAVRWRSRRG